MKVFFVYKNNTFEFTIKKDVTIASLRNRVSKLIQKDESSFDLIYNNKILPENNSTLFQIAKNETNVPIIISLRDSDGNSKKSNSMDKSIKLPLLTEPIQINQIKEENDETGNNLKLNLSESEIFSNSTTTKDFNQNSKDNFSYYTQMKRKNYISRNKVFEDIYSKKDEIIINLLNNFKKRILEYDDVLYKNFKNKFEKNNKQLVLFEKNLLNFKDRQIQYLKRLINHFDKAEASFFSVGKINFEEFYLELSKYYSSSGANTFVQNYSMKKENNIINNNNNNIKIINYGEDRLPNISRIKNIKENLLKPIRLTEDLSDNEREEILEKKEELNLILNKSPKKKKINPINLPKTFRNNSEPNLILNENITSIEKAPTKKKEKKEIFEKKEKIENKEKIEKKEKKEMKLIPEEKDNIINEEIPENTNKIENNLQLPSTKSVILGDREIIANYNKNKINVLFEISEENHEISEENSDNESSVDNVKNKKRKKKVLIEKNLRDRKLSMKYMPKGSIMGYKFKQNDKKKTHRIKKLGNSFSDFLI